MKAALLKSYGDVDQFEIGDIPTPKPGPGEILIKIEASAVNPFDLILRQGFMAKFIPLPLPAVLGGDAAGTISALGDGVTGFVVGDRVVADFAANGKGAHAEYGVLPATSVAKLPAGLSFEAGASLVKAGLTGRQAVEALGVKAGDRVLVSGGLGTVGRSAIQYLKQIGAQPVAGVRPERLSEGQALAGEALDITLLPQAPTLPMGSVPPGRWQPTSSAISVMAARSPASFRCRKAPMPQTASPSMNSSTAPTRRRSTPCWMLPCAACWSSRFPIPSLWRRSVRRRMRLRRAPRARSCSGIEGSRHGRSVVQIS
jgi:hypothetical protein